MPSVVYAAAARRDLEDIWLWLRHSAGETTADTIHDRIVDRIEQLADQPMMGPPRPDVAADARHLLCDRWLAFYLRGDRVEIARILDGSRDVRRLRI